MALSRDDERKIRLEELDALKAHLQNYNGERLARLKNPPAKPDSDSEAEVEVEVEPEAAACAECGETLEAGATECAKCGAAVEAEEGGSDADRLAELAAKS